MIYFIPSRFFKYIKRSHFHLKTLKRSEEQCSQEVLLPKALFALKSQELGGTGVTVNSEPCVIPESFSSLLQRASGRPYYRPLFFRYLTKGSTRSSLIPLPIIPHTYSSASLVYTHPHPSWSYGPFLSLQPSPPYRGLLLPLKSQCT